MKIALIRKEYTLKWGGAESYAVNLSRLLADRGHEVHVFANTWDLPADPGIIFHKIPMLSWYSPLKNLSFALNTRRILRSEEFDIVHGFSQAFPQDIYRAGDGLHCHNLAVQSTPALPALLNALNPRHRIILHIEKQIFKPHNHMRIIANSRLCKQQMQLYYSVPEERITVIYNGVDRDRFNPAVKSRYRAAVRASLAVSDHTKLILYVSRNYKRKGLRQLIESLSLLGEKKERVQLVVVGRGNPRPYRRLAAQLGIAEKLTFVGEDPFVEQYYGAADFLVLPTLYDPFSNVCLEALACGLPVITTRSNGASELISEGVNGYTIEDAGRLEEMAERIASLLPDGVCETMGRHAAESAQPYTREDNLQKTLELYNTVASLKNRFSFSRHDGMIVNRACEALLEQNSLLQFDAIMGCSRGTTVKVVTGQRSTVKLMLKDEAGETGVYLKRYGSPGVKARAGALLRFSRPRTALDEWKTIITFHRREIPTMIPLAAGMGTAAGMRSGSFLITRELEGTERLDHYLAREMVPPLSCHKVMNKRQLLKELALLVRRMHWSGFNHRDLYLCHLLVRKSAESAWTIYVADLHRVDARSRMPLRWRVKDLAAINYSADPRLITRTDRLRFMHHYRGGGKLDRPLKSLIRKIARKTERIRSHDRSIQQKRKNSQQAGNTLCEKTF